MFTSTTVFALVASVTAGSVLWDGRFNNYGTSAFLDDWSFSNPIGPYQYYIHGNESTREYVKLSEDYKNSADTSSEQGVQITIDGTSLWNGQTMMRTELIPQTSAAINKGKVFYHFSVQHTATNPPTQTEEHQVCFFESHFTELKYGVNGGSSNELQWFANSESQWSAPFEAEVWHNVAYGIDFDAQTVSLYHSTGADDLKLIVEPVSATTSSNGADWHLGILRIPGNGVAATTEDWHFSGVYIESGDVTLSVSGPYNSSDTSAPPASSAVSTSSAATTSLQAASRQAALSTAVPTTFQTRIRGTSAGTSSTGSTAIPLYSNSTTTTTFDELPSVATNLAATFSATASIKLTYTPTTWPTWLGIGRS
ncbi:hypothetical protein DOTSEDRAFT_89736 [Dothistroma septosporum NZE10]|uniref:Glycoside hydrolase 131 catalytic N-terminal domain-containing protein n=1 Tax=Dothistroma septosporum (strain NZE10 / CBS 128990) TaxID=675120 RepID=N1PJK7_DOTSN|nr:hypothetical protein DOTSEDRAFT_89736 [Dothistroma septosporum NZE10]